MGAYLISVPGHNAEEVDRMRRLLTEQLLRLERKGCHFHLEEARCGDRTVFRCTNRKMGRQPEKGFRYGLGTAVADYILTVMEPEQIRRIILKEFRYHDPKESRQIESYAFDLLRDHEVDGRNPFYPSRKDKMVKQVAHYFMKNRSLAVDGFVRFRMKKYRRVLVKLVRHAIDEYLLDQEYQEFIDLLKYFVSVQKSKVSLVHLLHLGKHRFDLLQADGSPLRLQEMDGVVQEMMDQALSQEDLIVSTLLSVAPERIILHTQDLQENVIRTLIQIFEGRIVVCDGCRECRSHMSSHGDA